MLKLAVLFLTVEGAAVLGWWALLLLYPAARQPFVATGAPDATLLAFLLPDILLYAGAALLAAYGLARRRRWGWPLLIVHAGAAVYAALYELALAVSGGGVWLGVLLMAPPALIVPLLVWRLRPGAEL